MKRTLAVSLQVALFFMADFVGSFLFHPFGVETRLRTPAIDLAARSFQWDGLLLMLLVFLTILAIEALRKRIRLAAPWSMFALAFAALAGYVLKFGFVTHKW